jgi:hypothetical protein
MNDTVIIFSAFSFVCRAQLWAHILGVLYNALIIKMFSCNLVCSQRFLVAEFTSPECTPLKRMVVQTFCATSSHSHSAPKRTGLTFPAVAYPGIFFGGGSTISVEDRENGDLGAVAP